MRKFDYEGLEERGEAHPATTEVRHKATNLKMGSSFRLISSIILSYMCLREGRIIIAYTCILGARERAVISRSITYNSRPYHSILSG